MTQTAFLRVMVPFFFSAATAIVGCGGGGDTSGSGATGGETGSGASGAGAAGGGETGGGGGNADNCAEQSATGTGDCETVIGFRWTSTTCVKVVGCNCEGADCANLAESEPACKEAHADCVAPPNVCDPQKAEGVGGCEPVLGYKWNGNECVVVSGCNCEGPDCTHLFDTAEGCVSEHLTCDEPPDPCAPQLAKGVGGCEVVLGYKWNGNECVALSGCSCEGAACDALFETLEGCNGEYSACSSVPPVCEPQKAQGAGDPNKLLGVAWNGQECVAVKGCKCEGPDCSKLADNVDGCANKHANCGSIGDACGPQKAEGIGACDTPIGVKWNGTECVKVVGCNCDGPSCGMLYDGVDACQAAHEVCLVCAPQKAAGTEPSFQGVKWNGSECVPIEACGCEGPDCANTYETIEGCTNKHADCP